MFSRVENEDQSYRIMMMSSIITEPFKSETTFINFNANNIMCMVAVVSSEKKMEGDVT